MDYLAYHKIKEDPVKQRETELVERKGIGHPDSICDGLAESVSRALCREYRERTGSILHHNTDEVQLVAGASNPKFGDGEIVEPIYILLTGRATKEFEGERIPVDRIAIEAAKEYIDSNFKVLNSDDVEFESRIGETSTDLKSVYDRELPMSNDTSFGTGHAPLSPTEKTVRTLEDKLLEIPEVGEDVKIMGLRDGDTLHITVAAAMIGERTESLEDYTETIEKVRKVSKKHAENISNLDAEVHVNTADSYEDGSVYLTVTGTSAEMGDDGSVGRGNRSNGLITPHRAMSMEASSGKNPVTHVGKIYNLASREIASGIYEESGEFAQVKMLAQIGSPIDEPKKVEVETAARQELVEEVVSKQLKNIKNITEKVVNGKLSTF